ncbi:MULTISPECIES: hypothetical protein [Lysobacter]|uniref:Lipocalin-like domain-containing protein n=1 Tax=Lysobacter firmicutimachus TaxID=1792846 RepID=A0ABU8D8Y9_9GAMM|nr:hypothetical protein [Lysobacter antibioticus]
MKPASIHVLTGALRPTLALALCLPASAAAAVDADTDGLIGSWNVETIADTDASGKTTCSYGVPPRAACCTTPPAACTRK